MSAIAGLIRFSGQPVEPAELSMAALRLKSTGIEEAVYHAEGPAGLVIRQHIITCEDMFERQPWVGGGGKLVFCYDGRLDNREEVASALNISLKGETVPDGRLFLAALERWGEAALPHFIGDFALVLWDKEKRKLLLACDQMGRRTLYYHQGAGFIAFASTYPALLSLPGVPKKVDELYIANFLILNTPQVNSTFYEGIHRLPSASTMIIDAKGLQLKRYWTPEPKSRLRLSSDNEYIEAAREHLDRAVACRLRSKDGIASTMSGGLDSSAVAATAARLIAPGQLLAVTTVPAEGIELPPAPSGCYNDERPYVQAIATRHPNMNLALTSSREPHWIDTDPTPLFETGGLPARSISNIGWFSPMYERLRKSGISALLTGECGNYAWSWDGMRSLSNLFRQGRWLKLAHELKQVSRYRPYDMDWKAVLRADILAPLQPPSMIKWRKQLKNRDDESWTCYSAINPEFAREIGLHDKNAHSDFNMPGFSSSDSLKFRINMLGQIEHGRDLMTALRMLHGVEQRQPLLDIRLIEFCLSIPDDQYLKDGMIRRLPRKALADRLPACVLENYKLGIQNPEIFGRMRGLHAGYIEEVEALKSSPLAARCIDLPRLELIAKNLTDDIQLTHMLPRAINVGRFLRWVEAS
jgi:asparagine synthase (glutamine-hydrolysing)